MKRKEWMILAVLIAGVAGLEVFGPGADMSPEDALSSNSIQDDVPGSADLAGPPDSVAEPMGPFRTVQLHVTGMT